MEINPASENQETPSQLQQGYDWQQAQACRNMIDQLQATNKQTILLYNRCREYISNSEDFMLVNAGQHYIEKLKIWLKKAEHLKQDLSSLLHFHDVIPQPPKPLRQFEDILPEYKILSKDYVTNNHLIAKLICFGKP